LANPFFNAAILDRDRRGVMQTMFKTRQALVFVGLLSVSLVVGTAAVPRSAQAEPQAPRTIAPVSSDQPKEKAKEEKQKLQGTWKLLSITQDGQESDKSNDDIQLIFSGDDFSAKVPSGDDHKGTFKVNPASKPRAIDIMLTEGPEKDKTAEGIYELKGDELRLCIAKPGNKGRPTEFASKPDSGILLVIAKRAKP
jgi:uncharacterized protein (TIGR03067 family)